ncbi:MAG TPA: hypothetical protein VMX13_12440 [Sedimentisphaerales bacterium]|nr:hypothetical protein [Sedimentisphaerales bacterium]
MNNSKSVSSEEDLSRLRSEDKITEAEYVELLAAIRKSATESARPSSGEPEFQVLRKRMLTYGFVVSIIGLPVGLVMNLPYVWGLSIVGIIVGGIRLGRIENGWLARIIRKNFGRRR